MNALIALKNLQQRNEKEYFVARSINKEKSLMKVIFPLGGITTSSGNWLFKQSLEVRVEQESGKCVASGDKLRMVSLEDMLYALNSR